jgi:hypothetical protein
MIKNDRLAYCICPSPKFVENQTEYILYSDIATLFIERDGEIWNISNNINILINQILIIPIDVTITFGNDTTTLILNNYGTIINYGTIKYYQTNQINIIGTFIGNPITILQIQ